MNLDDVVAAMRARFTPQQAGQVVAEAKITAEEWNTLAALVYLRDALEVVAEDPTPDALARAKAEVAKARSDDPSRDPLRGGRG